MKILYIVTQGEMGGAQKYVLDLAKRMPDSAIAAGQEAGTLLECAQAAGIPTYSVRHLRRAINPADDLLAAIEIRKLVRKLKPDIVHLNSSKAGVIGSMACIGTGSRVVFTAHGFVFNEPLSAPVRWLYILAEKISSWFRDMIIAVSEKDRELALAHSIIAPSKVTTIHNGIPEIAFLDQIDARKKLGIPEGKFVIGTIANFYRTKGLDVLIEGITKLPEDVKKNLQVTLIGNGRDFENCKLKIENYGLKDIITTPGALPNAAQYLPAFNVFVLPSRKEGFSYTLLEAMQAGLPIIATDVGGNREALGAAGILVPAQQPKALAEAIAGLANDPQARSALGQQAQAKSAEFTIEKMVAKTRELYNSLI